MTPKYRPDIDGLRAIAVLSVLFSHAGIKCFAGGYVGVDIFFVISGFLITTIIVRELENDNFSVSNFYERRFRRILPALSVVVFLSIVVGILLLESKHLVGLGKSALASSFFSSNILFNYESGYFDSPSKLKPLLHTWSLAVEEQYYIFYPLLLLLIARFGSKNYTKYLIPIGVLSLIYCIVKTQTDPSKAFYLITARAWELIIGSIVAIHASKVIKNQVVRDLLSVIGLISIVFSISFYTSDTEFPGYAAILPTIGTALIIYSGIGGESLVGRIISFRPIVFIGLISYSLYLWHWPAIVYVKYYSIKEIDNVNTLLLLSIVFILSVLSWNFVEKPFRKRRLLVKKRDVFVAASVVSVVILCFSFLVVIGDGFPGRYQDKLGYSFAADDPQRKHWGKCRNVTVTIPGKEDFCGIGEKGGDTDFLFWGDSHAIALAPAVDLSAKKYGVKGKIASSSACPPLLSIERPGRQSCEEFNETVLKYISERKNIRTVFLAARWTLSASGTRYKNEEGKPVKLIDIEPNNPIKGDNQKIFKIGLSRTVNRLKRLGRDVILVMPIPEIGYDVPSANIVSILTERDVNTLISPTESEYQRRNQSVIDIFLSMEREGLVKVIDPTEIICFDGSCHAVVNRIPLYRDDDHLSTFGAEYVSSSFDNAFSGIRGIQKKSGDKIHTFFRQ